MKNIGLLLLLALLAQSCLLSLFPLHTPETTVTNTNFAGNWRDKDGLKLAVSPPAEENKTYQITFTGKGKRYYYSGHLVKVNEMTILDLLPQAGPGQTDLEIIGELAYSLPTHNFLRCQLSTDTLKIAFVNPSYLDSLLAEQPRILNHLKLENDQTVLTSNTAQLQAFFQTHGRNSDLFKEVVVFSRKK